MTGRKLNPLEQPVPPARAIAHEQVNFGNHDFMNAVVHEFMRMVTP
jgi:hypothetical protein